MRDEPIEPSVDLGAMPFRDLVEHLPVVVYIDSDEPSPRSLYVSPNAEEILGVAPENWLTAEEWFGFAHPDDRARVRDEWSRAWETGKDFEQVYRFLHPSGRDVWVRDYTMAVTNSATGTRHWQGVIIDITTEVEAEDLRRESAVRYDALLENLPAVVYEMDPDDDRATRYVNRKIEDLLGYTMEEWLDQPDMWTEVLHPDDREIELAAHDLHSSTGDPWLREYRLIASEGNVVWVRDQATLLRDRNGHPTRWQGVMIDITTEKEAQAALAAAHEELEFRVRARTAQLQETNELMGIEIAERRRAESDRERVSSQMATILSNVPAVVYLWQARDWGHVDMFTYVGEQIGNMLGYSVEEWLQADWRDRVHPHDVARVEEATRRSVELGEPFQIEYRYLHRDGRVVWVIDHATMQRRNDQGQPLLFEGVMIDVTPLREAERKAQEAEDRFQTLVERVPVVLYGYTIVQHDPLVIEVDYLGSQIADILGIPPSEWLDDPVTGWYALVHPDDREWVRAASQEPRHTGNNWDLEYRMIGADGSVHWLSDRGACVARDEKGRPHRFVGAITDVTRGREEAAAGNRELATLRAALAGGPGVIWSEEIDNVSGSGRYLYLSPNVVEVLGMSAEELLAEPEHFERLVHPDDADRVMDRWATEHPTGRWEDTYRVIDNVGAVHWFHATGRRATPDGVNPEVWHGVTLDVTHEHEGKVHQSLAAPPAEATT